MDDHLGGVVLNQASKDNEQAALIKEAIDRLNAFHNESENDSTIRTRVRAVQEVFLLLRRLGKTLIPGMSARSARDRILAYLRANVGVVIDGEELQVVAGINQYARRIRELRVQGGWPIASGIAVREQWASELIDSDSTVSIPELEVDQYILLFDRQDRAAAARWKVANTIRRGPGGVRQKLLKYFRTYVGEKLTVDELRYVANYKSEWARRVRELRTEEAWPIVTRNSGDPSLPNGIYMLAEDRQGKPHDRHISMLTRKEVQRRDSGSCRWVGCGWPTGFPDSDQRFLEVHHIRQHVDGGEATPENLVTLCNLHHDEVHRTGKLLITEI